MSFNLNEFDRSLGRETQGESLSTYTAKTFLWMVLGLMVTFSIAIIGWASGATLYLLYQVPYLNLILLAATLVLAVSMSKRIEKMAVGTAVAMFVAFSAIFGITISVYLYIYTLGSVVFVFLGTAIYFGAMAAYGFLTKRDLTGLRPILVSGLIFLIAFAVLSMFIPGLAILDQVVCLIGIAIFLAYTAYDTQKIKAYYQYYSGYPDMLAKASIFSALQLYLDFINLFVYLLRFMGRRR